MTVTAFTLKHRPDQTAYTLNKMLAESRDLRRSIRVVSDDKQSVIIIGEGQPLNPDTGKPYPFGIYKYKVSGDKLIKEEQWI